MFIIVTLILFIIVINFYLKLNDNIYKPDHVYEIYGHLF